VVDGLKLQPCLPNFIAARDAIIAADLVNFQGKHVCTLWRGFARRGLGVDAVDEFILVTDGFDIPAACK